MATGLRGRYDAAASGDFQKKVAQALIEQAVVVYNEVVTTVGHAVRVSYALQVANNPPMTMVTNGADGVTQPDTRVFAFARVLTTQGIDNDSTDAAIQAGVAAVWNAMAGV